MILVWPKHLLGNVKLVGWCDTDGHSYKLKCESTDDKESWKGSAAMRLVMIAGSCTMASTVLVLPLLSSYLKNDN